MENNKYIDKVIGSLVRGTNIDYDKEEIQFPFPSQHPNSCRFSSLSLLRPTYRSPFPKYCKNTFGLTDDEIKYVWDQYGKILINKIEKGR